jgi:hypothetical protein
LAETLFASLVPAAVPNGPTTPWGPTVIALVELPPTEAVPQMSALPTASVAVTLTAAMLPLSTRTEEL